MTLHAYIPKTVSCTIKLSGWGNNLGPLTIRCSAQIWSKPTGQGWSMHTTTVLKKKLKLRFLWENYPQIGKILQFCSKRIHEPDSCFVFKFQENCLPGSGWNDALFEWQKSLRFLLPLCACLVESTNSLQGSMPCEPMSPCKILSQSVPICQSYSQKTAFARPKHRPLTQ